MDIYTITKELAPTLKNHCPDAVLSNVGQQGFYTLASFDDEDFLTGVIQFRLGNSTVRSEFAAIITYIYVQDIFRERGTAISLLGEVIDIARASDVPRIEVELLPEAQGQMELKDFFLKRHFTFNDDYCLYTGSAADMLRAPSLTQSVKTAVSTIEILSLRDFNQILGSLKENLSPAVRDINLYEKKVSTYFRSGSSCGMLLLRKRGASALEIVFYASTESADRASMLDLILLSARKIRDDYPDNTVIRIVTADKRNKNIIEKLCPGVTPHSLSRGIYEI